MHESTEGRSIHSRQAVLTCASHEIFGSFCDEDRLATKPLPAQAIRGAHRHTAAGKRT
jgi:hypothetical protein